MIKSVAVVGCGPASLAAAWGARGLGCHVTIFAPRYKSKLRGPILLQRPIPGMTLDHPDGYIKQHVTGGTILDYRAKLYGDINININGDILQPGYHAWKMHETYDKLWEEFYHDIHDSIVSPLFLLALQKEFDLVVNTAPATEFCSEGHTFTSKQVAITFETAYPDQDANTIWFNADPKVRWVRSSSVFGNLATEWPVERAPEDAVIITKPISTDCDCFPRVFRTGRFGSWHNETWVDTAYYDTRTAILS